MKIATITALALLVMAGSALAEQKYPPYPDVWERKLPVSRQDYPFAQTDIYPGPDGDMLAYQTFRLGDPRTAKLSFRRIAFFSGQDITVTEKELTRQEKKWPGPIPRTGGMRLEFPDGPEIRAMSYPSRFTGHWAECISILRFVKFPNYQSIKISKNITFVQILKNEIDGKSYPCHEYNIPKQYRTRITFPYPGTSEYYRLPDNTFLTVFGDEYEQYIVRFDRDLNSPFFDNHPNFLAIDTSLIEPIMAETSRREAEEPGFNAFQFFHDRVTELVMTMQKPAPR